MILSPEQHGIEQRHDDERQQRCEREAEDAVHRHAGQAHKSQDRHPLDGYLEQEQANGPAGRSLGGEAQAAMHPARAADSTGATVATRKRPQPFRLSRPAPRYASVVACRHILNGARERGV